MNKKLLLALAVVAVVLVVSNVATVRIVSDELLPPIRLGYVPEWTGPIPLMATVHFEGVVNDELPTTGEYLLYVVPESGEANVQQIIVGESHNFQAEYVAEVEGNFTAYVTGPNDSTSNIIQFQVVDLMPVPELPILPLVLVFTVLSALMILRRRK